MRILIQSVTVQDSRSAYYGKTVDMLAEDGVWVKIEASINEAADRVIQGNQLAWSPSCVDLRVHNTLPGGEFREDWTSLQAAALKGGVLDVVLLPTGNPVPQQAETIQYIASKGDVVTFHPMAPLSIDNKGENFTDLLDLHEAGARWFGHGAGALQQVDLMAKSIQYLQTHPVTIVSRPDMESLSLYGQVHEGLQSTLLGLKGIPVLSETMHIKRDLDLLRYVRGNDFGLVNPSFRLHFSCISARESVDLIRKAIAEGLPVSADIAVHQLIFTEEAIADFDTYKKVFPPFRTQSDVDALWEGLQDATIQAVVSDHLPCEIEAKELEFDHASFGTIGLETLFIAFLQAAEKRKLSDPHKFVTRNPAALLGIELPVVALGESVKGFVYDTIEARTFTVRDIVGKSKNTCFIGHDFTHQIISTLGAQIG